MKRKVFLVAVTLIIVSLCLGVFGSSAEDISDPSLIYEPQIAPYEDESIKMWFEHSFKKVMTSDTTPSGMNTYSVYMGKNEIENAQVVLCADKTMEKMRVSISKFTDSKGNSIDASMYYQLYMTLSDINTLDYYGATAENTFLKKGEYPDPVIPTGKIGRFQLNAGKSQAFYIRLTTTKDTEPGWYSAQFNVYNSASQIVKTATVYAYVWDFTLEDETVFKTSLYLANKPDTYGSYESYYNYLLENRLMAMDVPGELNSSNPYLTDDRVNAIRVTASGGGNVNTYIEFNPGLFADYADIYEDLSSLPQWDKIKDKFYFYTADEATSDEHQTLIQKYYESLGIKREKGATVDDVIKNAKVLSDFWPDAAKVVPYHENHPYPYNVYNTQTMAKLDPALLCDGVQAMIDEEAINIWCPQLYAFTPLEILNESGYHNNLAVKVRNLSGTVSGSILAGEMYFNWERVFGEFRDRAISSNIVRNQNGADNNVLWAYLAGTGGSYTYCNHLIENTGLQTKMLFWQFYQNDITGYLNYGVNQWNESDLSNGNYVDTTITGNKAGLWKNNKYANGDGYYMYGNGVLMYQATQYSLTNIEYIGSIRIDMMRDGVEEYQMLTMLEELEGDSVADAIVDSVSNNIAEYLSLPGYDRSHFDPSLDDYDVMAMKRIELGNKLEAASAKVCEHSYDNGAVTKNATCLELGEIVYICTKCGADKVEYIPALHSTDDCWNKKTVTETGCTTDGKYLYECKSCGYDKYVSVKSYHTDEEAWIYEHNEKMPNVHNIYCPSCNELLDNEKHVYIAEYTNSCEESGEHNRVCINCKHTVKVADADAYGHNYVDGACEYCGEADPDAVIAEKGDIDGNGSINSVDLFKMNLFVKQIVAPTETETAAADIDANGKVNSVDMFYLKYKILKGDWGN
ncbi:MAG: DUF4091 domain-containing protein [Clostridia bacterium]|nr:DUF4091 domain-containing protein [Clostridia bacterium]